MLNLIARMLKVLFAHYSLSFLHNYVDNQNYFQYLFTFFNGKSFVYK